MMKITTIQLERQKGKPLYIQIYEKIKHDIMQGYVKKGDQLPSIRKCETLLHVSKTSVERAYELLLDEGFIQSYAKVGYFIIVNDEQVRMRKMMEEEKTVLSQHSVRYDFRSQTMDVDSFDMTLWKKYLKSTLDQYVEIATYGDPQGEYNLRLALQKYAYSMRGVLCSCEQVVVGSSFQTLLYILCGLFDHKPVIGMEECGFSQAENVFKDYGFKVVKFTSLSDGIAMEQLHDCSVDLLYINSGSYGSDHQAITRKQAMQLLQWAKKNNTYILEDDHNGELRYQTRVLPAMQGFDPDGRIIYAGSFSKLLLPSLRISYMVLPLVFANGFQQRIASYAPTSSKIEQLALAHYIVDGHLQRHVKRLRKRYERKSTRFINALHMAFPDAALNLEESALQVALHFPNIVHCDHYQVMAKEHDVYLQCNEQNDIVLSFAGIDEDEIEQAIAFLKDLWKDM